MNVIEKSRAQAQWLMRGIVLVTILLLASGVFAQTDPHAGHNSPLALPPEATQAHQHTLGAADDGFFANLLKVYVPRRLCMNQEEGLIWLHVLADLLIAAAYYSIPVALITFVRRRKDLVFNWIFFLFAGFILLCGTTHVIGVLNIWQPYYRLDGIVKILTGIISVITAIALWPLIPRALAIPSRAGLELEIANRTDELRRSNEALRHSEERYRLVNKATNDVIWDHDLTTGAVVWSESLQKTFGHPATATAQNNGWWRERIHPEDRERVLAGVDQAMLEGKESWSDEYRFQRADGSYATVMDHAHVSRNEQGKPIRLVGAIVDQTERHQAMMERERLLAAEQKARADAEEASRLKDEFLATLSHELRTPLSAILGWAQLISRAKPSDSNVAEGVAVIDRNARAQLQLIEDLLDMSRIVSGKLHVEMEPLNVLEVAKRALDTIRPTAFAKEIRLEAPDFVKPVMIRGDAARLQQVLWNLLSNAVKFTPTRGVVNVDVTQRADEVLITVADSGIGIDPEFLPHVFERFRQADGSITRRHGGLGLGLSIVRSIVEAHGGSIHVESRGRGTGSSFILTLPLLARAEQRDATRQQRIELTSTTHAEVQNALLSDKLLSGLTVLAVDDDADVRSFLRKTLENFDARTIEASSAEQALHALQQERPDVLLIDIAMPVTDGYDLIRQIRLLPPDAGGTLPAAALTAFARSEDRTRALLAGFNLHIAKPVDPTDLAATIISLARLSGLR